ncbi:MAG: pentapeptide repeat-containing protein [Gammaproteobacteria bacterium]|nr:pentapeptide repeat-containing protein [Gammaproteobacteria bacterium]
MNDRTKSQHHLWYLRTDAGVQGPFPSGSVRRSLLLGRIGTGDQVSADGECWQSIADVPEVIPKELREQGQGENPALYAARRREDERSGLDRRGNARPTGKERRKLEPEQVQRRRLAKTALRQYSRRRDLPLGGLATVAMTLLVAIGYGLYLGAPEQQPDANCAAAPVAGVDWHNCRLDGVVAEAADLQGANLASAQLRGARMPGSVFTDADLQYADLAAADLSHGDFRNARMKGATLRNADLSYAALDGADLRHANLTGANPGGASFVRARLDAAIWLDGSKCGVDSIGGCRR